MVDDKNFDLICFIDKKDYDEDNKYNKRFASRGILIKNNKILLTKSKKYGEYKIPGGGIEENETIIEALIREVHEETGYRVIKDKIKPFGYYREKRKDLKEEGIFDQTSYYFLCEFDCNVDNPTPTESELNSGYEPIWVNIDEAINTNKSLENIKYTGTWILRERIVLEKIKKEIID